MLQKNWVKRELKSELKKWLKRREIILIRGARRVGKTALMRKIYDEVSEPKAFITCDDIDFLSRINTPSDLIFLLKAAYGFDDARRFVLFLDEFHYLPQPQLFLKNLYDGHPNLKMVVSGSSLFETIKGGEPLTGRIVEFKLMPFTFKEILPYKLGHEVEPSPKFFRMFRKEIERIFMDYIAFGGFPEVALEDELPIRVRWLGEYVQRYVQKDIVHFVRVENFMAFNSLLKLLASQIGGLVNLTEISNTLNISFQTVSRYLGIMVASFLVELVHPFARNPRTEISKNPKVYFCDLGLRNRLLGLNEAVSTAVDLGREVENFVFLTLASKFGGQNVKFYRKLTGAEIDFVVQVEPKKLILIEVKHRSKVRMPVVFKRFEAKYGRDFEITKILVTKDLYGWMHGTLAVPAPMLPFVLE